MGLFSSRKKNKNATTAPMTETKSQELPEEEQPTKFDAINEQAQVIEREIDSSSVTPSNTSIEEVSHEVISRSKEVLDSNEQTTGAEEDEEVVTAHYVLFSQKPPVTHSIGQTKILAIINQKGGVGKSTTAVNLAAALGALNKEVLLVDLDPQGNATTGVGMERGDIKNSIYEVLIKKCEIENSIIKTKSKNLWLIPAYLNLAGVDMELVELEREYREKNEPFSRVNRLKEEISKIKDNYDFIIIDCPPSLGILTTNALAASDSVLIPVQCEYFALEGIMQLINTIMLAQKKVNPNLDIEGVLLTMLTANTNLGLEVIESIRSFFKERVYDTIIPRLIRLAEAPSHGKPILEYEPRSRGTLAYLNLAKEVIERNGTKEESTR